METTVTRKGQVTIPVELRRKYGIRKGTKMEVLDGRNGNVLLKAVPRMEEWAGADAEKYAYSEMTKRLDRIRKKWR